MMSGNRLGSIVLIPATLFCRPTLLINRPMVLMNCPVILYLSSGGTKFRSDTADMRLQLPSFHASEHGLSFLNESKNSNWVKVPMAGLEPAR